jgi:hypothetical protein
VDDGHAIPGEFAAAVADFINPLGTRPLVQHEAADKAGADADGGCARWPDPRAAPLLGRTLPRRLLAGKAPGASGLGLALAEARLLVEARLLLTRDATGRLLALAEARRAGTARTLLTEARTGHRRLAGGADRRLTGLRRLDAALLRRQRLAGCHALRTLADRRLHGWGLLAPALLRGDRLAGNGTGSALADRRLTGRGLLAPALLRGDRLAGNRTGSALADRRLTARGLLDPALLRGDRLAGNGTGSALADRRLTARRLLAPALLRGDRLSGRHALRALADGGLDGLRLLGPALRCDGLAGNGAGSALANGWLPGRLLLTASLRHAARTLERLRRLALGGAAKRRAAVLRADGAGGRTLALTSRGWLRRRRDLRLGEARSGGLAGAGLRRVGRGAGSGRRRGRSPRRLDASWRRNARRCRTNGLANGGSRALWLLLDRWRLSLLLRWHRLDGRTLLDGRRLPLGRHLSRRHLLGRGRRARLLDLAAAKAGLGWALQLAAALTSATGTAATGAAPLGRTSGGPLAVRPPLARIALPRRLELGQFNAPRRQALGKAWGGCGENRQDSAGEQGACEGIHGRLPGIMRRPEGLAGPPWQP